jgi:hypothetical protein
VDLIIPLFYVAGGAATPPAEFNKLRSH